MKYLKKDYFFKKFKKSDKLNKKYIAVLENKKTGKFVNVYFGGIRPNGKPYPQYKDKALGIYKKYDHNDKERRDRYRKRHQKEEASFKNYWSPGYFATTFLWT